MSNINTGDPTNGTGTFGFNALNAYSYDGVISGSGAVAFYCGTVTLTQSNTYTGGTTLGYNALSGTSTVIYGANNATGSGSLTVAYGATLNLGGYSGTSAGVSLGIVQHQRHHHHRQQRRHHRRHVDKHRRLRRLSSALSLPCWQARSA